MKKFTKVNLLILIRKKVQMILHSVECMICHYCYFNDGFKYQPYVCNVCHEFSMTAQNLSGFFIVTIKNVDYGVYITGVDKKSSCFYFKKF